MALALRKISQLGKKKQKLELELTRYWDPHLYKRAVKLRPGEQHLSTTDEMLVTVAGVTSVVCLRDPQEGIIGMVNFCVPSQDISSLDASGHAQLFHFESLLRSTGEVDGGDRDTSGKRLG